MSTSVDYRPRKNITTTRFARENPTPRRGRPTTAWVLATGVKRLEVYNADKGGVIIEGGETETAESVERRAYRKAQTVGKRMGLKLRAIPFSSAFYQS